MFALALLAASLVVAPNATTVLHLPDTTSTFPQDPIDGTRAVVHGRLVSEDGAPLAGVTVGLEGTERVVAPASITSRIWSGPTVTSSADGSVRIEFAPPVLEGLQVRIEGDGRAPLKLSYRAVPAGGTLDLQDITVPLAGRILGQVLDRDGGLLIAGWNVRASPRSFSVHFEAGIGFGMKPAAIDSESGSFLITELIPGEYELVATGPGGVKSESTLVRVVGGATAEATLATNAPRSDQVLEVTLRFSAPDELAPAAETLYAVAPSGARVPLAPISPRSWYGVALERGEHTLIVEDPKFLRVELVIHPGVKTALDLEGSATLELEVVDPDTGTSIPQYGVEVRHLAVFDWRWRRSLLNPGGQGVAPRELVRVVPGEVELALSTIDRPLTVFPPVKVEAGATRALRLELGRGFVLTGRVVDARGIPVEGATIELTRGDVHGHVHGGPSAIKVQAGGQPPRAIPPVDVLVRSGQDGTFTAPDCTRGRWAVCVSLGPWVGRSSIVDLERGQPCELILPASTPIEVSLTNARGAYAVGCTLTVESIGPGNALPEWGRRHDPLHPNQDGQFPGVIVPVGRVRFELRAPETDRPGGGQTVWMSMEEVTPEMKLRIEH